MQESFKICDSKYNLQDIWFLQIHLFPPKNMVSALKPAVAEII